MALAVSCLVTVNLQSQQSGKTINSAGDFLSRDINAISSFKGDKGILYTAVLYRTKPGVYSEDCALAVLETAETATREVLHLSDQHCDWRQVAAFAGNRFNAFVLYAGHPDTWFGPVTVVALSGETFKVVYEGSLPGEVIDLDADNVPEIFESKWPDGDGHPEFTNVYAWDGHGYKLLTRVPWADRFGKAVLKLVSSHSTRKPPAKGAAAKTP